MNAAVRHQSGWIEVVCGCMFSGKTEELIRRLVKARYAKQRAQVFKPATDVRYAEEEVVSHSQVSIPCFPVERAGDILMKADPDCAVIGIDEAQFFDAELVRVCETLAERGHRVIVAGLDQDYMGLPFEPLPQLLAVAEYITKKLACCTVCGGPANRSQRLDAREARVVLGATDLYEARCRQHWDPHCFDGAQEALL